MANTYKSGSIAFLNISTGIYKFPKAEAALILTDTIKEHPIIDEITFVCFDDENYRIYKEILDEDKST